MVLHTLNALPASTAFRDCIAMAGPSDCILLLGQGAYAAKADSTGLSELASCGARICLLRDDMRAAGIESGLAATALLDMAQLVALTEEFPRQLAWY